MRRDLLSTILFGLLGCGCLKQRPVLVGTDEAAYLPCSGAPSCPNGVRSPCSLPDVVVDRPSLLDTASLAQGYLLLRPLAGNDQENTFIYDTKTGFLVATVPDIGGETYYKLPDGRLAPGMKCLGPQALLVGPIIWAPYKQAKELALAVAARGALTDGGADQEAAAIVSAMCTSAAYQAKRELRCGEVTCKVFGQGSSQARENGKPVAEVHGCNYAVSYECVADADAAAHYDYTCRRIPEARMSTRSGGRSYEAFGTKNVEAGSDPLPYAFAGEAFDSTTNLAYHRARWMDSRVGRFTGMDGASGFDRRPLTLHKYIYGNDEPVGHIDPSGFDGIGPSEQMDFYDPANVRLPDACGQDIGPAAPFMDLVAVDALDIAPAPIDGQPQTFKDEWSGLIFQYTCAPNKGQYWFTAPIKGPEDLTSDLGASYASYFPDLAKYNRNVVGFYHTHPLVQSHWDINLANDEPDREQQSGWNLYFGETYPNATHQLNASQWSDSFQIYGIQERTLGYTGIRPAWGYPPQRQIQ